MPLCRNHEFIVRMSRKPPLRCQSNVTQAQAPGQSLYPKVNLKGERSLMTGGVIVVVVKVGILLLDKRKIEGFVDAVQGSIITRRLV